MTTMSDPAWVDDVLGFWFDKLDRKSWFVKDAAIDAEIRDRFAPLIDEINTRPVEDAVSSPAHALATILVLDQFARNVFRGTPRAFAYDELARQSYFGQASISIADYRNEEAEPPRWELEIGLAIDSGLFADPSGHGIEGRFIAVAIRIPYLKWETWNDIGGGDYGPTFGARLMIDLLQVYHRFKKPT